MTKRKAYDKDGRHIGWFLDDKEGTTFQPFSEYEKLKVLIANSDFDGVVKTVVSEPMDAKELRTKLDILMKELKDLSTFESMSSKSKFELLTKARKAVKLFLEGARTITEKEALAKLQADYMALGEALNRYTTIKKEFKPIGKDSLIRYREALIDPKLDELDYYANRSVFMYGQRLTLFDIYKKGHLEKELAAYVAKDQGKGLTFYQKVDQMMAMLDREFPSGYIRVPIVKITKKGAAVNADARRSPRKMSLDYYLSVWLSDLQATMHTAATESAYLRAGIDLVMVKNMEDDNTCPLCSPNVGKMFSLSGKDPDFKLLPYIPLHPNCECYEVPMLDDGFWKENPPPAEDIVRAKKKLEKELANTPLKSSDAGAIDDFLDSVEKRRR